MLNFDQLIRILLKTLLRKDFPVAFSPVTISKCELPGVYLAWIGVLVSSEKKAELLRMF